MKEHQGPHATAMVGCVECVQVCTCMHCYTSKYRDLLPVFFIHLPRKAASPCTSLQESYQHPRGTLGTSSAQDTGSEWPMGPSASKRWMSLPPPKLHLAPPPPPPPPHQQKHVPRRVTLAVRLRLSHQSFLPTMH